MRKDKIEDKYRNLLDFYSYVVSSSDFDWLPNLPSPKFEYDGLEYHYDDESDQFEAIDNKHKWHYIGAHTKPPEIRMIDTKYRQHFITQEQMEKCISRYPEEMDEFRAEVARELRAHIMKINEILGSNIVCF